MGAMTKDTKQLVKKARKRHGLLLTARGKHKWLVTPDGKVVATISASTSDSRGVKNMRADLKRNGFPV